MFFHAHSSFALFFIAIMASGCTGNSKSIFRMTNLDNGATIVTDAKQRLVVNTRAAGGPGSNRPQRIVCAEPSPDVAQALSDAISASLQASSRSTARDQSGSAALGVATAASVAQLGERLGTIQLLRDGFYRACEAYSNGAITETMYALLVGRIDEVMTTMLATEVAGKAFGRNLASISGSAGANAGQLGEAVEEIANLSKQKRDKAAEIKEAEQKLEEEKGKSGDNASAITTANAELEKLEDQKEEIQKTIDDLVQATASASASGRAASNIGAVAAHRDDKAAISEAVAKIHRQHIDNDNIDSLMTACITALDRSPSYRYPRIRPTGGDIEYFDDGLAGHHPSRPPLNSRLSDTCSGLLNGKNGKQSVLLTLSKRKQAHAENMAKIKNKSAAYALAVKYLDRCLARPNERKEECARLGGILQTTGITPSYRPAKPMGGQVTIPNSKFTIQGTGTASLPLAPGSSTLDIFIDK